MGLTRMSLQELKEKSPADLLAFAEQFDIENANTMRKQDMMFAILKASAEEGVEISGPARWKWSRTASDFCAVPKPTTCPDPTISMSAPRKSGGSGFAPEIRWTAVSARRGKASVTSP